MPPNKKKTNNDLSSDLMSSKNMTKQTEENFSHVNDFMNDLYRGVNKELGEKSLIDLAKDDSAVVVKRFIPTGSKQLDYCITNNSSGGFPEGRIIEVCGPTASGKTTLALVAAANVQKMGGIVVYIDSEQALNLKRAAKLGINTKERFAYSTATVTERVFDIIEKTVLKIKSAEKDIPVIVIWDSVAAALPKAELEAEYDQQQMGLQARALRKGLRKINEILAGEKITLVIINHITQKIGVMYGSPDTTTGGTAIPFWSSLRIKIGNPSPIKKNEDIIGVAVSAKIIKNKIDRAHREVTFDIMFDEGIVEGDYIFDFLRSFSDKNKDVLINGKKVVVAGTTQWKEFQVSDPKTGEIFVEQKFYKSEFKDKILNNPEYKEYIQGLMDAAYVLNPDDSDHATLRPAENSDEELTDQSQPN